MNKNIRMPGKSENKRNKKDMIYCMNKWFFPLFSLFYIMCGIVCVFSKYYLQCPSNTLNYALIQNTTERNNHACKIIFFLFSFSCVNFAQQMASRIHFECIAFHANSADKSVRTGTCCQLHAGQHDWESEKNKWPWCICKSCLLSFSKYYLRGILIEPNKL